MGHGSNGRQIWTGHDPLARVARFCRLVEKRFFIEKPEWQKYLPAKIVSAT